MAEWPSGSANGDHSFPPGPTNGPQPGPNGVGDPYKWLYPGSPPPEHKHPPLGRDSTPPPPSKPHRLGAPGWAVLIVSWLVTAACVVLALVMLGGPGPWRGASTETVAETAAPAVTVAPVAHETDATLERLKAAWYFQSKENQDQMRQLWSDAQGNPALQGMMIDELMDAWSDEPQLQLTEEVVREFLDWTLTTGNAPTSPRASSASRVETPAEASVPPEYRAALRKAQSYSDNMHMSKRRLFDQLTSQYGEGFPDDAAQYAVDNVQADWNQNALEKARSYRDNQNMSNERIRRQLTSEYGEKFAEAEADYAIRNLD